MLSLRTIAVAAATVTFGLAGYAQTPVDHAAHHPDATPAAGIPTPMGGSGAPMTRMDEQMKTMQGMQGKGSMDGDMGMHHQMMDKRMQMMQSMMQMMMDRMPTAPNKP